MKFVKTVAISCLLPLATYAASPFDSMIASLNSIDSTLTSSSSVSTMTNQSLQSLNTSTNTLNMTMQSLNTSTGTLNTTNTALNSSTQSLNQTNGALNTSVQSLDQKINSLQGSVDSLKASIDSLAANASGSGSSGGSSSGGNGGSSISDELIYITNCSIQSPIVQNKYNFNYRCNRINNGLEPNFSLSKNANFVSSDVIFEVPSDRKFIISDINIFVASTPTLYCNIIMEELGVDGVVRFKKQLTRASAPLNYSSAQGGIVFSPGSKVLFSIGNCSSYSGADSTQSIVFDLTGRLTE